MPDHSTISALEAIRQQVSPLAADLSERARQVAIPLDLRGELATLAYSAAVADTEENRRALGRALRELNASIGALAASIAPVVAAIEAHAETLQGAAELLDPTPEVEE
jgi:hypothetical protein